MVAISIIKESNKHALPAVLPSGLTAVFLGATSGIGLASLKQFVIATDNKSPRVYVVGRSAKAATQLLAELRQSNPSATIEFIERDVSLIREVEPAVEQIKQRESKVDYLFISVGFVSFQGRIETKEGMEPSMTTRFYSRVRTIQLLLPLLRNSPNAHVHNVLAGGKESAVIEDDLDLAKPNNFSVSSSSVQSATMLTLLLEKWANENPEISFVHSYPGLVDTPVLTHGSSGITGFLLRWVVTPILRIFSTSAEDAGARVLFQATNSRYTATEKLSQAVALPEGVSKVQQPPGGVFLLDASSEPVDNEAVLADQRRYLTAKVWDHAQQIFAKVLQ